MVRQRLDVAESCRSATCAQAPKADAPTALRGVKFRNKSATHVLRGRPTAAALRREYPITRSYDRSQLVPVARRFDAVSGLPALARQLSDYLEDTQVGEPSSARTAPSCRFGSAQSRRWPWRRATSGNLLDTLRRRKKAVTLDICSRGPQKPKYYSDRVEFHSPSSVATAAHIQKATSSWTSHCLVRVGLIGSSETSSRRPGNQRRAGLSLRLAGE
jgi:hypothetical protein